MDEALSVSVTLTGKDVRRNLTSDTVGTTV